MIWKDVKGFEGLYQVSDDGQVRSLDKVVKQSNGKIRKFKGKPIKLTLNSYGYLQVILYDCGNGKLKRVNRLVAEAFIPNPKNLAFVNHKNGIKTDNRVENLEWVTPSENNLHAYRTGLQQKPKGELHPKHVLTLEQVKYIRNVCIPRDKKFGQSALARKFGVSPFTISQIMTNKTWKG